MESAALRPNAIARTAGALYLAVVALSIYALGAVSGLVDANDASATAERLASRLADFRLAVVANLVAGLCYVAVVGLLNELLRPVQPGISRIAVLFGLGGCIVGAGAAVLQLSAPASAAPVAQALLIAAGRANSVGLTFFGCYCLLIGWLVLRSGFIPKLLGILLMLSGTAWLGGNLAILVQPALAANFLLVVGIAAIGEILLALWLLLKGVSDRDPPASAAERG